MSQLRLERIAQVQSVMDSWYLEHLGDLVESGLAGFDVLCDEGEAWKGETLMRVRYRRTDGMSFELHVATPLERAPSVWTTLRAPKALLEILPAVLHDSVMENTPGQGRDVGAMVDAYLANHPEAASTLQQAALLQSLDRVISTAASVLRSAPLKSVTTHLVDGQRPDGLDRGVRVAFHVVENPKDIFDMTFRLIVTDDRERGAVGVPVIGDWETSLQMQLGTRAHMEALERKLLHVFSQSTAGDTVLAGAQALIEAITPQRHRTNRRTR